MSAKKTTKTIRPTNPADLGTEGAPSADGTRTTSSWSGRFRKTASFKAFRKMGRKTNGFHGI